MADEIKTTTDEGVSPAPAASLGAPPQITVDSTQDRFLNKRWYFEWRAMMAWSYIVVCVIDFAVAPLLVLVSNWFMHVPFEQAKEWVPVTLSGGAFYHLAMGGILGVSSWMKGSAEKVVAENLPDYSNLRH